MPISARVKRRRSTAHDGVIFLFRVPVWPDHGTGRVVGEGARMTTRRIFGALVAAIGIATATTGIAAADVPAGEADLGSAHFVKAGMTVDLPPMAGCLVDSNAGGSSGPIVEPGVTFGGGSSSCTRTVVDAPRDITSTTSTVKGQNFELSALVGLGGPRIGIAQYQLDCTGTQGHTSASWGLSGMSGLPALPSPVTPNYPEKITAVDGTVLATAVFDIIDQPGDGSTSLTMMRIDFAPGSGISGSVTVGETACTPTP